MKRIFTLLPIAVLISLILILPANTQAEDAPKVRAVMFWSAGCGHCHYVITEVLPPLQKEYGDQLEIVMIELNSETAARRFYAAGAAMGMAPDEMGVPMMIIGEHLLFGSQQIPDELPGLIERYLAEGGVDIPALPGMEGLALPAAAAEGSAAEQAATPSIEETTGISGSIPAFVVLVSLSLALIVVGVLLAMARRGSATPPTGGWVSWAIPVLALIGLAVAAYLAYIETQAAEAVCGPVGDCNAVQSSSYARVFGIPVGIIGIAGYLGILGAWVWGRSGNATARLLLLGMAAFGVAASIYLTWLELFVIEAVCMWCLSSAVIMGLILPAAAAWLATAWTPPKSKLRRRRATG
ncbi:MAG TPA: vitamin K epoxide reductase family protein [Promineifilum sp.]|nr:vitamin K epoxide reductase family protein [Promineifilum sp.]HRO89260.1 vitamin K epoxide reductase family protein [Promineifilum sp.]